MDMIYIAALIIGIILAGLGALLGMVAHRRTRALDRLAGELGLHREPGALPSYEGRLQGRDATLSYTRTMQTGGRYATFAKHIVYTARIANPEGIILVKTSSGIKGSTGGDTARSSVDLEDPRSPSAIAFTDRRLPPDARLAISDTEVTIELPYVPTWTLDVDALRYWIDQCMGIAERVDELGR